MRKKLLFLLLMVSFGLFAQSTDTIWTLVISEARYDRADHVYIELTNMGTTDLNLGEFELVSMNPWTTFGDDRWPDTEPPRSNERWTMLPDETLAAGESYIVAVLHDDVEEKYIEQVKQFGYSPDHGQWTTKPEVKALTDFPVHRRESGDPTDSVSVHRQLLETWGGRDALMLRHHPPGGGSDSCTVDQVNGFFSSDDGSNPGQYNDIAGFSRASGLTTLVRRFNVKKGSRVFVSGNDISESEWIPIPHQREGNDTYETWKSLFWTAGSHTNTIMDATTLLSSTIDIDWTDHILTVPYGVRNDDSIMYQFDRLNGLAWHYHYNDGDGSSEDSLANSVRTGDSLTLYACGVDLQTIKWHIEAAPPTADANWVIPFRKRNADGSAPENGSVWDVSHGVPVMDTISGIPFGTRTDSLLLYLEKPANASWKFVWVDGNERTDLLEGDKLEVTAEDGTSVKEYYLKLQKYRKARNPYLSYITWPDIPEVYKGLYGWTGDTIPGFSRSKFSYKVMVPYAVDGIPGLVAKNEDNNASHVLKRATNLSGGIDARTVTINTAAEDDTTVLEYNIVLEKQKNSADLQPWNGEPFISQYTWKADYGHCLMELMNPGNQPMDISNYMVYCGYDRDPNNAMTSGGLDTDADPANWDNRYTKYIPGYNWQSSADGAVEHSLAKQDVNINTNVQPGDVFVLAEIREASGTAWTTWEEYPFYNQIDVAFRHLESDPGYDGGSAVMTGWDNVNVFIWKIIGDSIKDGLKPATDPADFELIEVWGMLDEVSHLPVGEGSNGQVRSFHRKPAVFQGNPVHEGSFADNPEDSEWRMVTEADMSAAGFGWPDNRILLPDGTGSHFMDEATIFKSTVTSLSYIVSTGFGVEETIKGVVSATTVEGFFANVIKADAGQTLACVAVADGLELALTDALLNGDTLVVTSADAVNVSKYILEVTDDGLSDDAVLTSSSYTVAVTGATGTVGGFDYGTTLMAVADGVTIPAGASLVMVDDNDEYVPFTMLNFDTVYVDVLVTDHIYFEVTAEDGATVITYQLMPNSSATDAFVYSDVYMVEQDVLLISLIPQQISTATFLGNLVPAVGATLQLYDKLGFARNDGLIFMDDILEVTASDGVTTAEYQLNVLNLVSKSLAFVNSDAYIVDQTGFTITEVGVSTTAADFLANLVPSEGASIEAQTSEGVAKGDSELMLTGDQVMVTAGDGVTVNTYMVHLGGVGVDELSGAKVAIYPNPTTGLVNIAGTEVGSRIRVYNNVGVALVDVIVYNGMETISLDNQPAGMFFITISNNDVVTGQYKIIKR